MRDGCCSLEAWFRKKSKLKIRGVLAHSADPHPRDYRRGVVDSYFKLDFPEDSSLLRTNFILHLRLLFPRGITSAHHLYSFKSFPGARALGEL